MKYSFKDIVIDSRTGLNPRKNFVLGTGDTAYITIKDIYDGKINITDKTDRVDDEAIQIIKKRSRIAVGDILFVSIGRIGETAIVQEKDDTWDVNESVFVFTLNRNIILQDYFCLLFESDGVKNTLTKNSSGSTFKSIKMGQLEKMEFDIPSIEAQKVIVEKIQKVKTICSLRQVELEQFDNLIKARFVEMFGDPVVNTKGWEKKTLKEVCLKLNDGTHFSPESFETGAYKYVTAKNIKLNGFDFSNISYVSEEVHRSIYERCNPEYGDVLYIKDGVTTGIAIVNTLEEEFTLLSSVALLKQDRSIINGYFLCGVLNNSEMYADIRSNMGGAAITRLTIAKLNGIQVIVPPIELQNQFADFATQVDKSKLLEQIGGITI
jgi:type I restriction enzyme S subunit